MYLVVIIRFLFPYFLTQSLIDVRADLLIFFPVVINIRYLHKYVCMYMVYVYRYFKNVATVDFLYSFVVCSSIGKRPSITFRLTKMLKELPIKYFVSKMRRTEQFLLTYQQVIIPRVQVSYV